MKINILGMLAALVFAAAPSYATSEGVALEGTDQLTAPLAEDNEKLEEFLADRAAGEWNMQYWHCAAFPNNDPHHTHAHHAYSYDYRDAYYRALYDCEHYHHFCHVHCHVHH